MICFYFEVVFQNSYNLILNYLSNPWCVKRETYIDLDKKNKIKILKLQPITFVVGLDSILALPSRETYSM